ncbi:MAG TPA: VanZ family protein [Casimicrobiaceae bacterium]|nr:VanZ family protein [Casimicrobiaceae bacterium]
MDERFFTERGRTLLPHALATLYALSIVYASLEPFGGWLEPEPGTPFFLFAAWPSRWFRYDVLLNVVAYVPLGLFAALLPRRAAPMRRIAIGMLFGFTLSFAMETLQMFLPRRDASTIDLLSNTIGALAGAALGGALTRAEGVKSALSVTRARLFLGGRLGDVGIALLVLWLAAQINPGIPLFAVTFDPAPERVLAVASAPTERAALVIEAAESAFQMLGVGLFLALLLRGRRLVAGGVLLLIGVALLLKGAAATLVIKPAVWDVWQRPGVLMGIAAGALLIPAAISLPRPVMVASCAVALLSSIGVPMLAPDLLSAGAPLTFFNWRYGQLLNYNGLTRTILLVWPILAALWLFALAGRPAWGDPESARYSDYNRSR